MKNLKKVLITGTITLATLLTMTIASNAATVKVTGDVINVRKGASTDSSIVAQLSKNVECEYLGEEGNWYKIKYKTYTGYVSKDYSELIGDASSNTNNSNNENNTQTNNNEQNNETQSTDNTQTKTTQLVYKKFNQNTIIRLLPLVHSSNIGEAKKSEEVLILTETSGWSYVQTDEISGWVRTDTLGEAKTINTAEPSQNSNTTTTTTQKTGYISEDDVNMRSGAGTTYSVMKVLELNTQVTIIEESGNWYKVKVGNNTGYVSKDYVSDSKTVSNRSLSEERTAKEDNEENSVNDTKNTVKEDNTNNNKTTNTANITNNTTNKTATSTTTTTADTTSSSTKSSSITKTSTSSATTSSTTKTSTSTNSTIKGTDVIAYAKSFLGVPYVWGGASSSGFDCSGFTMYVYNHFNVSLEHYTVSQYNSSKGTKITKQSDLQMGDIVFLTDYETGSACGHCGIYISDGNFIHADSNVGYVNISNLNGIYKGRFCGALRIIK